ncbi:MAG TPA: EAL domain-containing protein, partial [Magnetospirillum sp.]|nr:EAL domain-containing protein [Magnetospirillum sp.]
MLSESQRSAIIRTAVTGRILARLFLTPNRLELVFAAVLSAGLIAAGAALVFVTGGTKLPYLHTLYLPIFLDSLFFGPVGGAVAGLLAGLSIGPFMPLDVNANVPQEAFGWSFRMGIFTLAGLVVGAVVSALRASMANTVLYGVLDEFTGLPNRQHLIGVLTTRLQSGAGQTVFSINLRSIRPIAIAFGIHTAEILLKRVAERLSVRLRAPDLLFRAESSALAVLSDSPGDFEILAEGLVATLSKPVEVEGVPLMLDASVGVAQAKPEDDPPDLVLRRAALAADDAHESGKPWSRYIRESDEVLRERLLMLGDVRVALDDGELTLAYQPKVRLSSGIMEGCEALVRWTSPARGMVPPDQFVPVVECSALIGSLTQYIFRAAIRQVAEWQG